MAKKFVIETGVAIPPHPSRTTYGFDLMTPGQSIFVTGEVECRKAMEASRKFAQRSGVKMVRRAMDGGLRIWRAE